MLEILEKKVDRKFEDAKNMLATKEDLVREVGNAKLEMIKWTIGTGLAVVALLIAAMKFFL